jgi:hypothetical protein
MEEEKKKKSPMYVSWGNILALIGLAAGGIATYTHLHADVEKTKTEIVNIKTNEIKRELIEKEHRDEIKINMREVKQDVKDLRQDVQLLIREIRRPSR